MYLEHPVYIYPVVLVTEQKQIDKRLTKENWAPSWQKKKWHVRPAKAQISLGMRPVWSESSLCAYWVAKGSSFLQADNEDSDQTGRMRRLICVFAGRTCHCVGFVTMRLKWCWIKLQYTVLFLFNLRWRRTGKGRNVLLQQLWGPDDREVNVKGLRWDYFQWNSDDLPFVRPWNV